MPSDEEITFADHAGRFYARRYGMAPMVGRLLGYLAVCDPHEQSITELADALLASRSAIAGAVNTLETPRAHPAIPGRGRADGPGAHRHVVAPSDGLRHLRVPGAGRAGPRGSAPAWPTPRPNGGRSCWSGRRSPISWWSGFPCWSRSGRSGGRRCEPPASSLRPRVPIERAERDDRPDQHAGDRGQGRVQVVRQPSGARQGQPDRGRGHDPRAAGPERGRQDHDRPHPLHPDPGRLRLHAHRRSRRGHRPRRGAGAHRGHRPVLGRGQPAHRGREPAVDGRSSPPRPRRWATAGDRVVGAVRPHRRRGQAAVDLLGRDATATRPGDDPRR